MISSIITNIVLYIPNNTQTGGTNNTLFVENTVSIILAFITAFSAYILGSWSWDWYKSPRLQAALKKVECNGLTNACYYNVVIRNVGRTACTNARVWVKLKGESTGKKYEYIAKWTSTPEPFGSYETATGGSNPQMQTLFVRSKGLIPSLLADSAQHLDLPSMPTEGSEVDGETFTILYWDNPTTTLTDDKGNFIIVNEGLKVFSTIEYYLLRFQPGRTLSTENYNGHIYVFGNGYSGVCEVTIENWDGKKPEKLCIKLKETKIKGCKSISIKLHRELEKCAK